MDFFFGRADTDIKKIHEETMDIYRDIRSMKATCNGDFHKLLNGATWKKVMKFDKIKKTTIDDYNEALKLAKKVQKETIAICKKT